MQSVDEKTVAFMDIGTNSVRLLIVRIAPNDSYITLTQQKEMVRLGENEFLGQYLQPAAMERAMLVCKKFAELARSYGAKEIIAVGTSAIRDARNQREFLRRLQDQAGIEVHVISGREEARLIYLGIASAVNLGNRQAAFIDIGGGSTELIVGGQKEYQFLGSLNLGAVRLTNLFFSPHETGPVSQERYATLQQYIRNTSVGVLQEMQKHNWQLTFGSSGTIENLADIAARVFHNRSRQRNDVITYYDLRRLIKILCESNLEQRRKLPGINPARADIIVAGAAILDTIMQELKIKEIRVISDRGLREGMLVDYLSRSEHRRFFEELSVRERSVLQLARACNFDEAHASQVARLALELFDSAKEIKLHTLGDHERELLYYASMLHDIGIFLSYDNHHLHTYYLIRNAELLGFDQTEIELIALIALFHRKSRPSKKKHEQYAALDKPKRKLVQFLSALLRVAEGLDRSRKAVIRHARFTNPKDHLVHLELQTVGDCQLELWGLEYRIPILERAIGRSVKVYVQTIT